MAKCKVLNRPDYELTLSSEEKEALQKLLYKVNLPECNRMGLTDSDVEDNNRTYRALETA